MKQILDRLRVGFSGLAILFLVISTLSAPDISSALWRGGVIFAVLAIAFAVIAKIEEEFETANNGEA